MTKFLTAVFRIPLPFGVLLIRGTDDDVPTKPPLRIRFRSGNTRARIRIPFHGAGRKYKGETEWTHVASNPILVVSIPEAEDPPHIELTARGGKDWGPLQLWLNERHPRFEAEARRITDRFLFTLRHTFGVPLVQGSTDLSPVPFANPVWRYTGRGTLSDRGWTMIPKGSPGLMLYPAFRVVPLTEDNLRAIQDGLREHAEVPLYRELLADARDMVARSDYRRAVIDLAVACEVALKHRLLVHGSIAARTWQYLEQNRQLRIGVHDLLQAARNIAPQEPPSSSSMLPDLISCRDRIVHHGVVEYRRTKNDPWQAVDRATVTAWWSAVADYVDWLETSLS